jgi:methylmalonyl-CoA/ethylmalonyl-CoA epimerase
MTTARLPAAGGDGLGPIGQIALHVADADRAEVFYRDVLGLPPLFRFGALCFFDCGGVRLMLEGGHAPRAQDDAPVCLYFRVTSIESCVAALQARGAVFEQLPHRVAKMPDHELWMAFLRDPADNLLALMEERRAPA